MLVRGDRLTEFPSGAVTFLFSDIEGSTRLVKALRERYAAVLAEHRQRLTLPRPRRRRSAARRWARPPPPSTCSC